MSASHVEPVHPLVLPGEGGELVDVRPVAQFVPDRLQHVLALVGVVRHLINDIGEWRWNFLSHRKFVRIRV